MATEYSAADSSVYEMMYKLIREDHPDLTVIMDKIVVSFRSPPAKTGGKPVLGKGGKVSAAENARHNTEFIFFIELSADHWYSDLDSDQKEALLYHHLCGFGYEPDGKTEDDSDGNGEYKPVLRGFDVMGYRDEFERYGIAWRPEFETDPLPMIRDVVQKKKVDTITPPVVFEEEADDSHYSANTIDRQDVYAEVQEKLSQRDLHIAEFLDGVPPLND